MDFFDYYPLQICDDNYVYVNTNRCAIGTAISRVIMNVSTLNLVSIRVIHMLVTVTNPSVMQSKMSLKIAFLKSVSESSATQDTCQTKNKFYLLSSTQLSL